MKEQAAALISVRPAHSKDIFTEKKRYELRRRKPNLAPGTCLWIYSTLPNGYIEGWAIVEEIISEHPKQLWNKYSEFFAVSESEFDNYFVNCEMGHAIRLLTPHRLSHPLSLDDIREDIPHFQPPQFYYHLQEPLLNIIFSHVGLHTFNSRNLTTCGV